MGSNAFAVLGIRVMLSLSYSLASVHVLVVVSYRRGSGDYFLLLKGIHF